jgi:hypothetical protein
MLVGAIVLKLPDLVDAGKAARLPKSKFADLLS